MVSKYCRILITPDHIQSLNINWIFIKIKELKRGVKIKQLIRKDKILTTCCLKKFLSIFLFLTYPFIRPNVSVYILIIQKWSKWRAWSPFCLNTNEIRPLKIIRKNHDLTFSGFFRISNFLCVALHEIFVELIACI